MAATTSKSLWEHLQEQQKPFVLDIYLSERRRMLNKNPRRACSCSLNKRRILSTKKILKLVLYKFTCTSQSQKVSGCLKAHKRQPVSRTIERSRRIGGTNRFPKLSMSSSAAFSVSLKCAVQDSPRYDNRVSLLARISRALEQGSWKEKDKVITDKNREWGCKEDSEQLSPVSVLSEVSQLSEVFHRLQRGEAASPSSITLTESSEEEAFLWELPIKSMIENQSHSGLGELMKIFGAGQQSKQLLFDCVKEAIEALRRKNETNYAPQEFIGLQELGKMICEQIYSLGAPKAGQQMNIDVFSTKQDCEDGKQLSRKIGIEIGDTIMDEIVREVVDLLMQ